MTDFEHKNLVIGCVRGYTYEDLRPFVESLRQTSFPGAVVFLCNALPEECMEQLQRHGIILVPFPCRGGALNSWSRFWPYLRPFVRLPIGTTLRKVLYSRILNLAFVRYVHALNYLEPQASEFGRVLWTDVRDVVFQDDPFAVPPTSDIEAFGEAPHMLFGQHPMNDGWLLNNYGKEKLDQLAGNPISCCGTVMGTSPGMVEYFRAFVAEIQHLKSIGHGADTSIHNVLLRERMKTKIRFVENLTGSVSTVGENRFEELSFTEDGRIRNSGGEVCPVIHQYDRHAELVERVNQRLFPSS